MPKSYGVEWEFQTLAVILLTWPFEFCFLEGQLDNCLEGIIDLTQCATLFWT